MDKTLSRINLDLDLDLDLDVDRDTRKQAAGLCIGLLLLLASERMVYVQDQVEV